MVISLSTPAYEVPSENTSLLSQFGCFDWDISENEMAICPYLSEILAFETTNITQDFNDWYDLNHPDDLTCIDLMLESIKSKQTLYAVSESRILCRDGQWRWFGMRGKVIELDNNGNPLRVVGTCTDITKLKENAIQLEEKCNELENILAFLIEQMPASIALFDTEMRHKFVSDSWKRENNLGELHEFIGKTYYEVYPKEPKIWRENYQKVLNGEIIKWTPFKCIDHSGKIYWSEGRAAPWYAIDGSIAGLIMYSTDVTENVMSEKNLKKLIDDLKCANQALEHSNTSLKHSNEALESFAHICSHDLKEPLRSASNFIHLLFTRNIESFDEESLLYMRHALKGMDRMGALIQDILLYSKIAGRTEHKKIHLDMHKFMSEIKEAFAYQIAEIGAEINIGNLPPILGEPTQINQLFINLIGNALKFHSEKPLVINIFAVDRNSLWEFHVCDNGIGIAQEYHESIFTMFKRLHTKNQYEGSGIGLATCQKIMNDHQGEIYIQSIPEGGSDFVCTFPKINT